MDLYGEADHLEPVVRQLLQVGQLLDLAVRDLASRKVPFPDNGRVVVQLEPGSGEGERRIPAPRVGADEPDPPARQVQRGRSPHSAPTIEVIFLTVACAGRGIYEDDIAWGQFVPDAQQLRVYLVWADDVAVGQMAKIQLDAGAKAPFQWNLVDRRRRLAFIRLGPIMVGCVHVSPRVGTHTDELNRPTLPAWQVVYVQARKHLGHLRGSGVMVDVIQMGQEPR